MSVVVERATQLLLDQILVSKDAPQPTALQLLTVIFQRHGSLFSKASSQVQAAIGNGDDRQKYEEVLRSIALVS
jgi:hypothetical protein